MTGEWTNCGNCGKKLPKERSCYCSDRCKEGTPNQPLNLLEDDATWNGVWDHIAPEPITITGGRAELLEVCRQHGKAPKALLKPRSQGKGYEVQTKRSI